MAFGVASAALALGVAVTAWWAVTRRAPSAEPPPLSALRALGPAPDDARFERAFAPRELRFPDDHGPHPTFRNEWWYWTGNLDGPAGRRFGYQLTVFRSALAPPTSERRASAWAARQIYMAHLALTDVAAGRFYAYERTSRAALELAGATARPFHVWVLDWDVAGPAGREGGSDGSTPVRLRAATDEGIAIDLSLSQGKAPVLEGTRGLSQKGRAPGNASYYYSLTRMPTAGQVTVGGEHFPVRGASWMDREWSTSALESGLAGWDWLSLQLSDGRELMYYRLRETDGSAAPWSGGTLIDAAGNARTLTRAQVSLQPVGTWRSPRSGTRYPAGFRLRVPDAGLALELTPLVADQELDVSFRYWEGAVAVSGTAGSAAVSGRGYLELTGYGEAASPPAP